MPKKDWFKNLDITKTKADGVNDDICSYCGTKLDDPEHDVEICHKECMQAYEEACRWWEKL